MICFLQMTLDSALLFSQLRFVWWTAFWSRPASSRMSTGSHWRFPIGWSSNILVHTVICDVSLYECAQTVHVIFNNSVSLTATRRGSGRKESVDILTLSCLRWCINSCRGSIMTQCNFWWDTFILKCQKRHLIKKTNRCCMNTCAGVCASCLSSAAVCVCWSEAVPSGPAVGKSTCGQMDSKRMKYSSCMVSLHVQWYAKLCVDLKLFCVLVFLSAVFMVHLVLLHSDFE